MKATFGRQIAVPVALLALTATGCATGHTGQVAASVGSHQVTTSQLADFMSDLHKSQQGAAASAADELGWQRQLLGYLVQRQIFGILAAQEGVTISDADVSAMVTELGGEDKVQADVAKQHMPASVERTLLESLAIETKLIDKWVPVSDAQLQADYQTGIDAYQQLKVTFVTTGSQAQAEQLAAKVRAAPASFAEDAAAVVGPGTAPKETPLSAKSQFGATLGAQLWAAKVGDVIAANAGGKWRVLLVTAHEEQTFEQAKPALLKAAQKDKVGSVVQDHIAQIEKSDPIVVNPRFGTWDAAGSVVTELGAETVKKNDSVSVTGGGLGADLPGGTAPDGTAPDGSGTGGTGTDGSGAPAAPGQGTTSAP